LVDDQGNIYLQQTNPTQAELGLDLGAERIANHIKRFQSAAIRKGYTPQAIGLGAPGIINRERGLVQFSPNLPEWRDVPLAQAIRQKTNIPVFLDNDANMVTYGEHWMGVGRDFNNFLCLTLGTGVGSGLVLNGKLWFGSQGLGPEFGHITVIPGGERCGCGNRGCLETLASANSLVKKAQKGMARGRSTLLTQLIGGRREALTAKLVYQGALRNDPFCLSLLADLGKYLGLALANSIHLLGLEGVVLGGGLSRASTIFLPYLEKEFKKRMTMAFADRVSIRISSLGDKSGILGAAKMAFERF
ncbi:MAG TPA: ROK family protein, partial [Thermodesulfobacteriota bacterium]|nr:ROK family protein [Thermodesulfobacteriota bacterium]